MLQALGLFCMGLSSRRGCRAEILAHDFHFQKCTTLHTKPPVFEIFAIPPRPNACFQNDFKNSLIIIANCPSQLAKTSQFCHTSQLIFEFPYRMGCIARIRRFELFEWKVLHFWSYFFTRPKWRGGGCSWEFWGALGAPPPGMLQLPWHVTAALACYRTLQLSFILGSCSWFALASLLIVFELVLLG